jgi:Mg2+ and Co2+ transporter CorA
MFRLAVLFLAITLFATLFGFHFVPGADWYYAIIFAVVLLVLVLLARLSGCGDGRRGDL